MVAGSIPAHRHARRAAITGAEQSDLGAKGILVDVVLRLQTIEQAGHRLTGDFGETASSNARVVGVRVSRVPLGREADAPVLVRRNCADVVVVVFTLGVDEFAESSSLEYFPHGMAVGTEAGRLEHHIIEAAGFDGFKQFVGVFQGTESGRHGASDVFAVLEDVDAVPGVAWGVGGHEHRLCSRDG